MKQNLFTAPGPVLDEKGRPIPGYSTKSVRTFERKAIKASPFRIKEWDFYQVSDKEKCLQFTYGHTSYVGQVGIMFFDFKKGEWIANFDTLIPLPFGKLGMPEDAEKDHILKWDKDGIFMEFEVKGDVRVLRCSSPKNNFETEITLTRENPECIVINIPFDEKPTQFYYNHKINCMRAKGKATVNGVDYVFDPADSFGLLDWGRGVWPFSNDWFWSNGTGELNGEVFGFNLGCGFGNVDAATENIVFWQGKSHKLGKVSIVHQEDWLKPWVLKDEEGRLELTMYPDFDRTTKIKIAFIDNCCHQVFGRFKGWVVLDDGTKLDIDNIWAFAEHAVNNW